MVQENQLSFAILYVDNQSKELVESIFLDSPEKVVIFQLTNPYTNIFREGLKDLNMRDRECLYKFYSVKFLNPNIVKFLIIKYSHLN